jgi:hypothetical protein
MAIYSSFEEPTNKMQQSLHIRIIPTDTKGKRQQAIGGGSTDARGQFPQRKIRQRQAAHKLFLPPSASNKTPPFPSIWAEKIARKL